MTATGELRGWRRCPRARCVDRKGRRDLSIPSHLSTTTPDVRSSAVRLNVFSHRHLVVELPDHPLGQSGTRCIGPCLEIRLLLHAGDERESYIGGPVDVLPAGDSVATSSTNAVCSGCEWGRHRTRARRISEAVGHW